MYISVLVNFETSNFEPWLLKDFIKWLSKAICRL